MFVQACFRTNVNESGKASIEQQRCSVEFVFE